jgi:cobalt-zinc-cadmium efflux system outer membrane protein
MLGRAIQSFIAVSLLAIPSGASTAPPVEALVAEALARSPALAAARARLAGTQELERPAEALPDPMVEAMVQDANFPHYTIGTEDMSMAGVEVRQPLPYPGKRRARGEVARAETALRAAEAARVERRIAVEVRKLYARIYAVDAELRSLLPARELLDLMTATATSRYAAGEAEQEAVLKAQLQASRLEEMVDDHHGSRATLVAELNRWLDRPAGSPLGEVTALPPVLVSEFSEETLSGSAATAAAEVVIAAAKVAAAEKRLAADRLDLKPDFSPAAGIAARGPLGPVLTLRFGVELPFWKERKQEPRIRAAELELEGARQEMRDAAAAARAEAARLAAEWTRSERQILRFREAIMPQTSAAFDAARSSYLAGRGDFSSVVEDFNLWLEARVQLARREADRFAAWAEIEGLRGPSPPSPGEGGRGGGRGGQGGEGLGGVRGSEGELP